jgi:type I restriction enzyme, S subunit
LTWKYDSIGNLCETGAGGTPLKSKQEYYRNGTIPWLLSGEVAQGEIFSAKSFISSQGLKNSAAKLFPINSVLVAMYGATAGQVGLLKFEASTNQAVCAIFPSQHFLPKFLYYAMLSKKEELISQASGNAQPNISQIKIRQTIVPVPPLPEQQRIVAILDEAFAGLAVAAANAEKNLKNASELFECTLQNVMEGKLFRKSAERKPVSAGSDFVSADSGIKNSEIPFEIPHTWRWSRFGNLVKLLNGDRGKNYPNKNEYVSTGVAWINTGHIKPDGSLSREGMNFITREKFDSLGGGRIVSGDLVYCLRGATIGKTAFVSPYTEGAVASSLVIVRPGLKIDRRFAYYFLTSRLGKALIKRFDNGAAQPNLAANSVAKYITPLPPIAEQIEIVESLDEVSNECQRLQSVYFEQLKNITELKQALLQKAFAGELTKDFHVSIVPPKITARVKA